MGVEYEGRFPVTNDTWKLAVIATILVVIGVADLIASPPSENLGPVGSSERGPIDVVLRPL